MKAPQVKVSSLDFSSSTSESKNSSVSVGGGYSQSGGWNANITYTKKW
jgi:outer membrane translocation and assembly module TamA